MAGFSDMVEAPFWPKAVGFSDMGFRIFLPWDVGFSYGAFVFLTASIS